MYEKSRLHPISIFYNVLKSLKELIFPFIGIILVGGNPTQWEWFTYLIVSIILLALILGGLLSWYYFSYYVKDRELRIEHGVFVKKKRYIPFERIQSMDFTEGILHRPFRLVKVKIETAGGAGESEAEFSAISQVQARELKEYIASNKNLTIEEEEDLQKDKEKEVIYQISTKQLLALAATSGGIGVIISAGIAFASQFEEFIPYKLIFSHLRAFVSNGIAIISLVVFLILLLLWACSLLITLLKYANFTLSRTDEDILITRGLLEKKQITIPIERIQAVKITESVLRQPFKLASLSFISAGGSLTDMEAATVVAIPLARKSVLRDICQRIMPDYELYDTMTPPPKRALWRYIVKDSWLAIPISALLIYFFHGWGLLSLLLFILLPLWGYIKFRTAGYHLSVKQLTLVFRLIDKTTILMRRNRIQSLYSSEGPWQRKGNLGSIYGEVASGIGGASGAVKELELKDVQRIYEWYSIK